MYHSYDCHYSMTVITGKQNQKKARHYIKPSTNITVALQKKKKKEKKPNNMT